MIDLLRERLTKADRIIVQVERALRHFQREERANRPGGCYCEDGEGGYHNHTGYCERASQLMSATRWYLKREEVVPPILISDADAIKAIVLSHLRDTKGAIEFRELAEKITVNIMEQGFRR